MILVTDYPFNKKNTTAIMVGLNPSGFLAHAALTNIGVLEIAFDTQRQLP